MDIDLFAGVAVSDLARAITWFDRFFGEAESFDPNDTERVWTVAEHRHLYVELQPRACRGSGLAVLRPRRPLHPADQLSHQHHLDPSAQFCAATAVARSRAGSRTKSKRTAGSESGNTITVPAWSRHWSGIRNRRPPVFSSSRKPT